MLAALTALSMLVGMVGLAVPATAATGDFSLDFVAAAPGSYNHLTGGGAYDDRTIGKNADVVESLEGGDFACGDIVTYFIAVTVDDTARADADAPQTIDLGFQFLMDTTGKSGVAIGDITYVGVNYGTVEDLIAGQNTVDDGIVDDGGSTATLVSETMTGTMFEPGGVLNGTVRINDLERAETVIVRIDTQLYCQAPATPTGNLQADLSTAQLVFIDDTVAATPPTAIPGGAQTIPFKQFGGLQYPQIALQKTVVAAGGTCPGVESLQVLAGSTVRYCYVVSNAGDAALYDVTVLDDHATPGAVGDDFAVTLTSGLSDQDEDGFADDLAAGGSASGYANVPVPAGTGTGTYTNTATASGDVAFYLGSEQLTDTDTASIVIVAAPAIDIQKTPNSQTVIYGQAATFTITVTNTGNVPLTAVAVTDPAAPNCARTIGALAVGAVSTYTCTLTITSSLTNVAYVTGMYGTTQVSDNDDAAVTVDILPDVTVTKTGSPTSVPETGGNVTFTYQVTNNSSEQATITALSDDKFGTLTGDSDCQVSTILAAGATCSFTATFAIPAGDHPGSHVDIFSATVADDQGNQDTATDNETITYTDVLPDISVTKTGSPTSVPETGGNVLFTFVVTNSSTEAATITALSDDQFGTLVGDAGCAVGTVIPGAGSCTFSATFPIPAGDYPGSHVNVFTATVSDGDGNTDTASDNETITYTDVLPDITVTKTAGVLEIPETGDDVTFTYTVTNNSSERATVTVLSDDKFGTLAGDADCQVGTILAPTASCEFSATFAVPPGDAPNTHVNVFTATVSDGDDNTDTATDDATVTYTDVPPTIEVTKTPSASTVPETGADVTFTFTVKNTSTLESVTILSLEDDVFGTLAGDADCAVGTVLAAGATCEFTLEEWIDGDFVGSAHTNMFTAVAEDDEGTDATDEDDATVGFTDVAPTIVVTKTANPTSVPETGGDVTFSFSVQNTSTQEPVTILSLEDSVYGTLAGDTDCTVGTVLAAGATCTFELTRWVEGDFSGPDHVNLFTAVAEDNDGTGATDSDDATVVLTDVAPSIVVTKDANPTSVPETGGLVEFTFTVQNTSTEEAVTITSLTDTVYGSLNGDADCQVGTLLPAGTSCTFSLTRWVEGDFTGPAHSNTFTAVAVDNDGTQATDDDPAAVTFRDVLPTIEVTKTPSPTSVPETGGVVTFTFVVTNTSLEESVTILSLTDSIYGTLTGDSDCQVGTVIAAGASCEFTSTRTVEGDFSGPDHVNLFTAVAEDNDGTDATDDDDATVDFTDVAPAIVVTKTANPTSVPETGADVTFTFTVQNTSTEEAVTITSLTDSVYGTLTGDADCQVGTVLAAGATCTFELTRWVEGDFSGPDHANVFTAVAVDDDTTPATDEDDATVDFTDVAPTILVTKDASPTAVPETGADVTFTFTVTNTSTEEPVTVLSLTDSVYGTLTGDADCQVGTVLAAGATCTFELTLGVAGDFSGPDHVNLFTAVAEDNDGTDATDDDDAAVDFTDVAPAIVVTKTANPTSVPETGGDVTFTFLVENPGPEDVTLTSLNDTVFGDLDGGGTCEIPQTIVVGGSYTCTYTTRLSSDSLAAHTNVVTATAVDDDNTPASDTDDETVTFTDVAPAITITKTANPTSVPETGGNVTFTFLVENTGVEDVTLTTLSDDRFGDLNGQGTCVLPQTILIGDVYTCSITTPLSSDSLAAHTNVVTATAVDDDNTPATDTDDETVTFTDVAPSIQVTKTADPTSVPETGGDVTFTFLVENIGVEDVVLTSLEDDVFEDLNGQGDCVVPQTILIGDSYSCSITVFLSSDSLTAHSNLVTAIAVDDDGTPASDTDDETVTFTDVAPAIQVTKTADPTSVPETGGFVTFTFVVENTGVEDVNLTILNDSRFGDLDGKGTCEVPQAILIGDSYSCTYTVLLTSDSLAAHSNVVTATAVDEEGTPASDTDDETVTFTDVAPLIQITKSASPVSVPETGGNVTFTFLVENIGVEDVTLTTLSDTVLGDLDGKGTCDVPQAILVGDSYSCSITVFLSSDSLTAHTNVVTATAVDDDNTPATDDDTETVTFIDVAPAITITKTANPVSVPETGGNVTFTFLVENIGVEDVEVTSLTDTVFGDLNGQGDCTVGQTILIGDSYSCSITRFLASDSLTAHTNVATVIAVDDDGTTDTDDDTETVTFDDVAPAITITKTANPTSVPETGGNVTFTFLVTNTGQEDVTLTTLSDDRFGNLDGQGTCDVPRTIWIGWSYSCSITEFLASDSLTAHTNVVTATAVDDENTPASDTDDETVTFDDVAPAITLTKTASPTSVPETGGFVTFTFVVTNTGVEDVTVTSLTDTVFGDLDGRGSCAVGRGILIGASYSCSITEFLASDSLTPHYDVVSATVVDDDGTPTSDTDDETVTFTDVAPSIQVTKTADPTSVPETGGNVTFTFLVENIGVEDVEVTSLTDTVFGDLNGQGTCDVPQAILIGDSYSCSITQFLASDSLTAHTNVATVIAVDDDGTTDTDDDTETVTFDDVAPAITITKTANPASVPETGGNVTFTFLVTNTGQEDVTLTTLSDDRFGNLDGQGTCDVPATILIGGTYSCTYTVFLASDSLTAHTNVVTATAVDDDGTTDTDDDTETVTFDDVAPAITITKTANPTSVPETGGNVAFTFLVTNTGVEDVTLTTLSDDRFGNLDGKGTCDVPATILIGGTYTCTYTVLLASDSLTAHTNVVTATAVDDDNTPASDTDDETVTFTDVAPAITITKTASPTSVPETGANVTFTFLVTNTGAEDVNLTTLTDTVFGNLDGKGTCDVPRTILIGASYTCTYTTRLSSDSLTAHYDVVSATAVDDEGTPATDTDDETVTFTDVAPTIQITKTANPTAVQWTGGNVTFTFLVENIGAEDLTLTVLTDSKFGDLNGKGDCVVGQTILIGGSYTCTYTVFLSSPDFSSHTNVATSTGVDDEGTSATDTDDATVTFWWYGRTPGYWKTHPEVWTGASWTTYSPSTRVASVFTIPKCLKDAQGELDFVSPAGQDTLLQALGYKGSSTVKGKAEILLRAATAALLNEQYYGAGYPPYGSTAELIAAVNTALASCNGTTYTTVAAQLDGWNNGNHAVRP